MKEACIFCKIVKGEVPCHKIYEDSDCLAFLDAFPHAKGHTVVVPKTHAITTFDLNDDKVGKLNIAIKRAMERIFDVLSPQGFNVGWNHNKVAGQAVAHLHVHIMPRWDGDGGGSIHSIIKNPGEMSIKEVGKLFE